MLALILVIFIFALIVAKYFYENRQFYQLAAELPHGKWDRWLDSCLPLLGYGHRFLGNSGDTYDTIRILAEKTIEVGGIMKLWMGPYLYAMITDPSAAEILLNTCLQKDKTYRFGESWTGIGLVIADFPLWKRNRKLFNPAFSARVADGYVGAMNERWKILLERLKPLAGKGILNVKNYLDKCSLDALCKTALSVDCFNLQNDEHLPFLEAVQDHTNLIFSRAFRPWLHPNIIFHMTSFGKRERRNLKIMHEFSYKIIRIKREELKKRPKSNDFDSANASKQIPYLELLLKLCDEEKTITEEQVRADIDSALEAGYASSSITIGVLLSLLGRHPEIQEKLYNEIKHYYGNSMRDVEKSDFTHLSYLDCVIKEVLRIYPLTPIVIRCTQQDVKISDKVTLPSGCGIIISPLGLHHDPKVWGEDHDTFRPERWEDKEAASNRHACSFIPFSYGARNCIGKYHGFIQLKIAAVQLVRQFKMHADPAVPMTFKLELFSKQRSGVMVALETR